MMSSSSSSELSAKAACASVLWSCVLSGPFSNGRLFKAPRLTQHKALNLTQHNITLPKIGCRISLMVLTVNLFFCSLFKPFLNLFLSFRFVCCSLANANSVLKLLQEGKSTPQECEVTGRRGKPCRHGDASQFGEEQIVYARARRGRIRRARLGSAGLVLLKVKS